MGTPCHEQLTQIHDHYATCLQIEKKRDMFIGYIERTVVGNVQYEYPVSCDTIFTYRFQPLPPCCPFQVATESKMITVWDPVDGIPIYSKPLRQGDELKMEKLSNQHVETTHHTIVHQPTYGPVRLAVTQFDCHQEEGLTATHHLGYAHMPLSNARKQQQQQQQQQKDNDEQQHISSPFMDMDEECMTIIHQNIATELVAIFSELVTKAVAEMIDDSDEWYDSDEEDDWEHENETQQDESLMKADSDLLASLSSSPDTLSF